MGEFNDCFGQIRVYRQLVSALGWTWLALVLCPIAWGSEDPELIPLQRFVQNVNRSSPLETAGSHSSHRFNLGAGVKMAPLPAHATPFLYQELELDQSERKELVAFPQLWVTKGLYYPLDIGASFTTLWKEGLSQASSYLQWTVYESFALPALATRLTYSRTFGLKNVEVDAIGLQLMSSWGFRFLSFYAGLSMDYHRFRFYQPSLAPTRTAGLEVTRLVGIHLQLIPAFLYAVIDTQQDAYGEETFSAKLSMDI